MVSPLCSNERHKPGYGQLYISDSSEARNRRMENNQACLHSVMEELHALLRSINLFAESYLQMHQLMQSNSAVNVEMVLWNIQISTCAGIMHLLQGQRLLQYLSEMK
ncbi:hypothetical protein AVEN_113524-1 [Araneus ventricosus]|uniref:Uncharacterized protein n=1 Tax=Araneus ventricosus TaxID=182803 RepID=A0A4Y2KKP9_ARAVE|nr:hypothetical protein AVEN_113524-1 [Araneus ventricosus]